MKMLVTVRVHFVRELRIANCETIRVISMNEIRKHSRGGGMKACELQES